MARLLERQPRPRDGVKRAMSDSNLLVLAIGVAAAGGSAAAPLLKQGKPQRRCASRKSRVGVVKIRSVGSQGKAAWLELLKLVRDGHHGQLPWAPRYRNDGVCKKTQLPNYKCIAGTSCVESWVRQRHFSLVCARAFP